MLQYLPTEIDWESEKDTCDVIALSVNGDVVSAEEHGVYVSDEQVKYHFIMCTSGNLVLDIDLGYHNGYGSAMMCT